MTGTLAIVGGAEFSAECDFDADLVGADGEVLVLPTAHAFEDPAATISAAKNHFESLGSTVRTLDVYTRRDALDPEKYQAVKDAQVIYITGGSPMHLRSVLAESPLLGTLVDAWERGATVVVAAEAGAVMCSHMVDFRGGAFTVGIGVVTTMTVIPKFNRWSEEKFHRTMQLAAPELTLVAVEDATALIRSSDGQWNVQGAGKVEVFRAGNRLGLEDLPESLS